MMKIYVGKNKREAKEVSLKSLMLSRFHKAFKLMKSCHVDGDRFGDDSASWIDIRQPVKDGVVDITIGFDPETDNDIDNIRVWKSKYVLDEENMKEIT